MRVARHPVPERVERRRGVNRAARVRRQVEIVERKLRRVPEQIEHARAEDVRGAAVRGRSRSVVLAVIEVCEEDVGLVQDAVEADGDDAPDVERAQDRVLVRRGA